MTRTFRQIYGRFHLDLTKAVLRELEAPSLNLTCEQSRIIAQRINDCTDAFRVMVASPQVHSSPLRVRREQQMCVTYLTGHIPSLASAIVNTPSHADFTSTITAIKNKFYPWFFILYNTQTASD